MPRSTRSELSCCQSCAVVDGAHQATRRLTYQSDISNSPCIPRMCHVGMCVLITRGCKHNTGISGQEQSATGVGQRHLCMSSSFVLVILLLVLLTDTVCAARDCICSVRSATITWMDAVIWLRCSSVVSMSLVVSIVPDVLVSWPLEKAPALSSACR